MAGPSISRCNAWTLWTGCTARGDQDVTQVDPGRAGRAARNHLDHAQPQLLAETFGDRRRQRYRHAGHAKPGPPDPAVVEQLADDVTGRRVDRHREAEAVPGDGRVDADHRAGGVGQRTTGVARVQRGVGLDDAVDDADASPVAGRQGPAQAGDHTGRDRAGQAHRVADGHHELADAQTVGVAERGRRRTGAVHPDDGEVGQRIRPDHVELGLGALREARGAAVGTGHHVGVGEQESVFGEGDRRTGAGAPRGADGESCDGGQKAGGDAGHDTAVGIECLTFDTRVFGIHARKTTRATRSCPVVVRPRRTSRYA